LFEVECGYDKSYTDDNVGINEIQTKIISLIMENPSITIPVLAEKVGIANRTVERNLKFLKDNGIIEREGAKRRGKWIVKKA